ncbi:MAG: hemerythrin family protein [Lachnospiraceae bacterium]|nr:hemerythrin family protein [Lachnospiraceae bacterium]
MKKLGEEYLTGLEQIDAEHVHLLDLIEKTRNLLEDENMLFKCADIRVLLAGLKDYTIEHFAHEEAYLESIGYPGLYAHKIQHQLFAQKLVELTKEVDRLTLGTQDDMIRELFEYLQVWLHDHIKIEDMKYAKFADTKA